jgi:N-acetylglucosamine-6-phosphate deacetylase
MKDCKITNARIPGYDGWQEIAIRDRQIVAIATSIEIDLPTVDVEGDWISLGGVDLQINGALGLAFPDMRMEDLDRLPQICDFLWAQGVNEFLPTIVTTSIENIHRSLAVLAAYMGRTSASVPATFGIRFCY